MSAMLPPRPHTLEAHHPTTTVLRLEQPKALITGDTILCVTEPEAALHPITGRYRNTDLPGSCSGDRKRCAGSGGIKWCVCPGCRDKR